MVSSESRAGDPNGNPPPRSTSTKKILISSNQILKHSPPIQICPLPIHRNLIPHNSHITSWRSVPKVCRCHQDRHLSRRNGSSSIRVAHLRMSSRSKILPPRRLHRRPQLRIVRRSQTSWPL
jgi:hypothetical protein